MYELNSDLSSSDEEYVAPVRYTGFKRGEDLESPQFYPGLKFGSKAEFKATIQDCAIHNGKDIQFQPDDKVRVRAKCKPPREWYQLVMTQMIL